MDEITLKHIKKGQYKEKIRFLFFFNLMKMNSTSFFYYLSLYNGIYIIFLYYTLQLISSFILKYMTYQDNENLSINFLSFFSYAFPSSLTIIKSILKYILYLISFFLLVFSIKSNSSFSSSVILSNLSYKNREENNLYAYYSYSIQLALLLLNIIMNIQSFHYFYILFIGLDLYFCWIYYSITCFLYDNKKFAVFSLRTHSGLFHDKDIYKFLEENEKFEVAIQIRDEEYEERNSYKEALLNEKI